MKSKSFNLKEKEGSAGKTKRNKSYDFVSLYVSAAETNAKLLEQRNSDACISKENNFDTKTSAGTPNRERSPYKKKKKGKNEPVDISHIDIDGRSLNASLNNFAGRSSPVDLSRATSTPCAGGKSRSQSKVKSIMKSSSTEDAMEETNIDISTPKPKKRNKSVSFMLDDTEEVAIKKTKSNDSLQVDKKSKNKKNDIKNLRKLKKRLQAEKENTANVNMETEQNQKIESTDKISRTKTKSADSASDTQNQVQDKKKKKLKKLKKRKKVDESSEPTDNESNNNEPSEHKVKKLKHKKHSKSLQATDKMDAEGEPASKARKKEAKADIITEDLENLSIGDNAHTLTNLLDEMTVIDKDKKKKNKHRRKKDKAQKTASVSSSETADLEKIEEGKEKVKWKKRKWNKDRKGDVEDDSLLTSVIVENLPLKIMFSYKKLLTDHFGKLGLIKRIGIAEVYPTEEPKPVFTTTITFYSEGAASKALEEDNTTFEGGRVRVKRPLPPTQTTLVVRSYGDLTEQALSSVFTGAGRIRSMRHLVKGKKSMATSFVEFDGPEAVGRAVKMAEDAKVGGKKIHVSKFELRGAKLRKKKKARNTADSENEGDSEDSND